jgi:MarR family transcriptional regulator, organic hydroperoxide resistance regulator
MPIDFTRTRYAEPGDSLGYLLHQLASLWRRRMNARLAEIGLTHTQFVFLIGLAWLARTGADVTQKDLGHYHKASRALTSRVVRLLERNGLVVQKVKADDARARMLKITVEGTRRLKLALPVLDHTEDVFLAETPALKRRVKRDLRAALAHELAKLSDSGPDDVED